MHTSYWISFLGLILFFSFSCGEVKNADHTGHSDHHDANAHMNRMAFSDLVKVFEAEERAEWQKPDSVISHLGILNGKAVADIGAGTGYFSFPLLEKAEKVIAIDLDERFIEYLKDKKDQMADSLKERLDIRLASTESPNLDSAETDIILMVNTYHHIENRILYFMDLQTALRDSGKVVIIDYFKRDLPVGPSPEHKLPLNEVMRELETAGYKSLDLDTTLLPYQYILTASLYEAE